jgi:type IV secretory pathway VirB4 component
LKTIDFSGEGGDLVKAKLAVFDEGGLYHGLFDSDNRFEFRKGDVIGINLYTLTDEYFTQHFFPDEKKLIDQFTANLGIHGSIRFGLIYALTYYLTKDSQTPKILAVDNMDSVFSLNYYSLIETIFHNLAQNNGVVVANFNLSILQSTNTAICQKWLKLVDTNIILPSDVKL